MIIPKPTKSQDAGTLSGEVYRLPDGFGAGAEYIGIIHMGGGAARACGRHATVGEALDALNAELANVPEAVGAEIVQTVKRLVVGRRLHARIPGDLAD